MNQTGRVPGILTITSLLIMLVTSSIFTTEVQARHDISNEILSDKETQSAQDSEVLEPLAALSADMNPLDHDPRITTLIDYLMGNGHDINEMLQDSRFEIYEGIGNRFRNSAERRSLSLDEYKGILGFEDKKSRISNFIETHQEKLAEAEETYGVSRYIIAAIIGIESDYGRNIGSYNPFNSYVSMYAVDYRAEFARAQLEELLIFIKRNNIDVFELKSSYAGAMSYAQFIPYSLNQWWVGDDIFNMDHNILSVGNYLAHFANITGSVEEAVFRYNPSRLYQSAVLDLAKEAEAISRI